MAMFRRSVNEQGNEAAEELTLLRTEFGQELRTGLAELRGLNTDLRQQLGARLESGLQDVRDELRDLHRELNDVHKTITEARRESESLRLELETARRQAAEARTEFSGGGAEGSIPPVAASVPEAMHMTTAQPPVLDKEVAQAASNSESQAQASTPAIQWTLDAVLEQAAGVSAADLICHRDAWAFIVEQGARNAHFRVPGLATSGDDAEQTNVTLSGRTLIAVLSALHTTQHSHATSREDRALASTYYSRIASVITDALPAQGDATRTRIVIDDRPPVSTEQ